MGAWIEISYIYRKKYNEAQVAPLMGAWIEIIVSIATPCISLSSRPSWARGLK